MCASLVEEALAGEALAPWVSQLQAGTGRRLLVRRPQVEAAEGAATMNGPYTTANSDEGSAHAAPPSALQGAEASSAPATAPRPFYVQCVHSSEAIKYMAGGAAAGTDNDAASARAAVNARGRAWVAADPSDVPASSSSPAPPSIVNVSYDLLGEAAASHSGGASPALQQVTELLAHELTHLTDVTRHGFDLSTAGHLACSEVRAAALSTCRERVIDAIEPTAGAASRVFGGYLARRCVSSEASRSVDMVFPGAGAALVGTVLPWCFTTPLAGAVTSGAGDSGKARTASVVAALLAYNAAAPGRELAAALAAEQGRAPV